MPGKLPSRELANWPTGQSGRLPVFINTFLTAVSTEMKAVGSTERPRPHGVYKNGRKTTNKKHVI